jgi:Flagellar biosynthesis pathway, component FliQ
LPRYESVDMESGDIINLGGSAIWTAALVASPILLTALAVGFNHRHPPGGNLDTRDDS